MNTPRKKRRFDLEKWRSAYWPNASKGSGQFSLALDDPEAASEFALLVTEFTHLEFMMEHVLARLMHTDTVTASHVMRSVFSNAARIKLMETLLQRGRRNADKSLDFDEILREFDTLRSSRNDFVHARWQTDMVTRTIFLIRPRDDPFVLDLAAMEEFDIEELKQVRNRISDLISKIFTTIGKDVEQEVPAASDLPS